MEPEDNERCRHGMIRKYCVHCRTASDRHDEAKARLIKRMIDSGAEFEATAPPPIPRAPDKKKGSGRRRSLGNCVYHPARRAVSTFEGLEVCRSCYSRLYYRRKRGISDTSPAWQRTHRSIRNEHPTSVTIRFCGGPGTEDRTQILKDLVREAKRSNLSIVNTAAALIVEGLQGRRAARRAET